MKKACLFLSILCCIIKANAANPHATQINLEDGKYMYFILNDEDKTAIVTWGGLQDFSGTDIYVGDIQIPNVVENEGVKYNVKYIGEKAFYGCEGLKSITLPKGLENIGPEAFAECKDLTTIIFPKEMHRIAVNAFENCKNLRSISLPEGLEEIATEAFKNCVGLTSLTIPSTVTKIGEYAFDGIEFNEVYVYSTILKIGAVGFASWNKQIPTYISGISYKYYKEYVFKNYNVKVFPNDSTMGDAIKSDFDFSPEETNVINNLLRIRTTMGKKQAGPMIEVEGEDGQTIKLYKVKNVKFSKSLSDGDNE